MIPARRPRDPVPMIDEAVDTSLIVGEARATVRATPDEVFAFVLDLERYRRADHKIGRVGEMRRNGNAGTVRFSGRLRGLPGPAGTYPFTLTGDRLVFGTPVAGPARWFLEHFEGSFDCEPTDDGTLVTHREAYRFRRPWRWLADRLLRSWLENDTAGEMVRLKALLEAGQEAQEAQSADATDAGEEGSAP